MVKSYRALNTFGPTIPPNAMVRHERVHAAEFGIAQAVAAAVQHDRDAALDAGGQRRRGRSVLSRPLK